MASFACNEIENPSLLTFCKLLSFIIKAIGYLLLIGFNLLSYRNWFASIIYVGLNVMRPLALVLSFYTHRLAMNESLGILSSFEYGTLIAIAIFHSFALIT